MNIRPAAVKDIGFVRDLAVEACVYGIPPHRKVDLAAARASMRQNLADLEISLKMRRDFLILVAEQDQALVGYIMLDFGQSEPCTGQPQGYIVDLAVRRSHWGQGTTHALMAEAVAETRRRGLRWLVGTVSANNTRTLDIAQGALDFRIERHQIVRDCEQS